MKLRIRYTRTFRNVVLTVFAAAATFFCYYFLFAVHVDTPIDAELKASIRQLRDEYEKLEDYGQQVEAVLLNLEQRDSALYYQIFNKYPGQPANGPQTMPANLFDKSNIELVGLLSRGTDRLTADAADTRGTLSGLQEDLLAQTAVLPYLPSIQPIVNNDLSINITPAGARIDPFYKDVFTHKGIDYLLPEDTRVFATAGGIVEKVGGRDSKEGIHIVINHNNRYSTVYSYLNKATVRRGQRVAAGEIIGYSGNTGISFAPHLHYEVLYKNRPLDPTDFFFRELGPHAVQLLKEKAEQNIQALD